MVRLTEKQLQEKVQWVHNYKKAKNPADGSTLDANANVTSKNIVTLGAEINKDINIQINRALIKDQIKTLFGEELSNEYIEDLESHLIYTQDETSLNPYCVSISMYPFLLEGMTCFGDENASGAPTHLRSFCGSYVNMVQHVAGNFAGAVATIEFLLYFDYFARKDFGDDYLNIHNDTVNQELQGVIYLLNQESVARGGQALFVNLSTFDKYFFDGIFGDFIFPDLTKPNWETLNKLQLFWHKWFRKERTKKLLTFPIVTHCAIANAEGTDWKDLESAEFISEELSKGGEFFIYTSKTADSLSSCCRLKNMIQENTFSYSLGAGGLATGSKNVITLNVNRMTQTGVKLEDIIDRIQKYQIAFNEHFKEFQRHGLLPVYDSGMITLDQQYLTIGLNGILESAEFLGYEISNNVEYKAYLKNLLGRIKQMNKDAKEKYGVLMNSEVTPAENLGVKNAKWDKKDGLKVNRDCYNSYFYRVEDDVSLLDKLELHGGEILDNLDGGSAVHFNNSERLTTPQYRQILKSLITTGSNYFCENVMKTCCNSCGKITANTLKECPHCGSDNVDYATRIIGYLKKIHNFAEARQQEASKRNYA